MIGREIRGSVKGRLDHLSLNGGGERKRRSLSILDFDFYFCFVSIRRHTKRKKGEEIESQKGEKKRKETQKTKLNENSYIFIAVIEEFDWDRRWMDGVDGYNLLVIARRFFSRFFFFFYAFSVFKAVSWPTKLLWSIIFYLCHELVQKRDILCIEII
jgi:hypothetical protein